MMHFNKFSKRILAVALLLTGWLSAYAFNVNGIYYDFVDKTNRVVKVSYRGESPKSYKGEYIGDITIPPTVIYNGVKYFVSEIDWGTFEDCPNLTSVTIPHSVEKIGNGAFSGCSGLTSIFIPNSVKEIDCYNLFENCPNLNSIEVEDWNPNYNSQNNCNAIIETSTNTLFVGSNNTIIPNSVQNIGYEAFSGRSRLKNIVIPISVKYIECDAFQGCNGLESIIVEEGNCKYDSRNNCNAIIETSTNTLMVGCNNTIIPNSVVGIDEGAFRGCNGLTSVTIPSLVASIGYGAFMDCKRLTTVNFNAVNCEIWCADDGLPGPFSGCDALKTINIGNNVKYISSCLFYECGLTSISIPNSVTRVDCYGWDVIEKIIIPRGTRQKFKRIFPKEYHSKLVEQ